MAVFIAAISCFAPPASAQTTDIYGGLLSAPCTNATGRFIFLKQGTRWWYCTPAGHLFWMVAIGGFSTFTPNDTTDPVTGVQVRIMSVSNRKYGTASGCGWASANQYRLIGWNFNTIGQNSNSNALPTSPSCTPAIKIPMTPEILASNLAAWNFTNYGAGDFLKDLNYGTDTHWHQGGAGAFDRETMDFFWPTLQTFITNYLKGDATLKLTLGSPYLAGFFIDDSDFVWGSGAGTAYQTVPPGHTSDHNGMEVAITSPVQAYNPYVDSSRGKISIAYPNPIVYSKTAMASPPANCNITTPCSWRTYLAKKYGTIGALNTSWGTGGFYTTFDSSGTCVGGSYNTTPPLCSPGNVVSAEETIGIGNGSQTTFSFTLAHHTNIAPYSLQIWARPNCAPPIGCGTILPSGGDCTSVHVGFQSCSAPAGTGIIGGPTTGNTIASGSINYSTGAGTVTFIVAPAANVVITADYIDCGFGCGTGVMDENGRHAWMGTKTDCLTTLECVVQTPNANANFGADGDAWIGQFYAQYFSKIRAGIKAADPNALYLGLDNIGAWGVPARRQILAAAGLYSDALFPVIFPDQPDPVTAASMMTYTEQYGGDLPLIDIGFLHATGDTSLYQYNMSQVVVEDKTQENRAARYSSYLSSLQNRLGFNGSNQWVGFSWWTLYDLWGEKTNWGLVSMTDNPYNGVNDCNSITTETLGPTTYTSTAEPIIASWAPSTATTAVSQGNGALHYRIQATVNGSAFLFEPQNSGTTGSGSPPTFSAVINSITGDNGINWKNVGLLSSSTCNGNVISGVSAANLSWRLLAGGAPPPPGPPTGLTLVAH